MKLTPQKLEGWGYRTIKNFIILTSAVLADRTNGRAYATVLRLSVCLSSVTLCIVAKRCVLEQKLLKCQTRDPNTLRAQYLENYLS